MPAGAGDEGGADATALQIAPGAGLLRGLLFRTGLRRRVHVWGLDLEVPWRRMDPHWRWLLRNGRYELAETLGAYRTFDPTLPTVEVGGGIGAVSCAVNRILRDPTAHVVVEVDPEIAAVLRRNRDRNGARFKVRQAALAYGEARFAPLRAFVGQGVGAQGAPVVATTLEELLHAQGWDRVNLLLDIEGMELDLFEREPEVLRRHVERLVVELHGHKAGHRRSATALPALMALGFTPMYTRHRVWGFQRA